MSSLFGDRSDFGQPSLHDPPHQPFGERMFGCEADRAAADAEAKPHGLVEMRLAHHVDRAVPGGGAEVDQPLTVLLEGRDAVRDALARARCCGFDRPAKGAERGAEFRGHLGEILVDRRWRRPAGGALDVAHRGPRSVGRVDQLVGHLLVDDDALGLGLSEQADHSREPRGGALPLPSNSRPMSTRIGMLMSPVRTSGSVFGSNRSWNSSPSITKRITTMTTATNFLI